MVLNDLMVLAIIIKDSTRQIPHIGLTMGAGHIGLGLGLASRIPLA